MRKIKKLVFICFSRADSKTLFTRFLLSGFLGASLVLLSSQNTLAQEVSTEAAAAPVYPQFKFNGDLRLRHEHVEKQGGAISNYEHQRIRARLGTTVKIEDDTQLEFRMATGAGRTSTNQTLGNNTSSGASTQSMANYNFLLDRANVDWAFADGMNLRGGRFGNPFYQPGDSDMVWDSDLNFDGLAVKAKSEGGSWTPFMNAGFFWILKDLATPGKDVLLGAVQLGVQNKISDQSRWSLEAAYYAYSGLKGHQGVTSPTSTDGNTYDVPSAGGSNRLYAKSFKLVEGGADFTTSVADKAFTIFNHYITNTKANPRPGMIAGFKWGTLKAKGDWSVGYDFRRVPEDSTLGAFTDGDSFGGGTNGWSHRLAGAYQVRKSWGLGAAYFYGKSNIAKGQTRLKRQLIQADLNLKF